MAQSVTIRAFVRAPFDRYVSDELRFWNASGLSVKLGATGVDVQLELLRALLLGGIAFDTPSDQASTLRSASRATCSPCSRTTMPTAASDSRKIPVISYFPGSVRGLGPGSEVTMHGLVVGHVVDVRLSYDPVKDAIVAPVRYEVEPERILGLDAKTIFKTPAEAVAAVVKRGLRASLQSSSLITGQQMVTLDFVPNAPSEDVKMEGSDFVLPTTEGGGIAGITASASVLLDKVMSFRLSKSAKTSMAFFVLPTIRQTVHRCGRL